MGSAQLEYNLEGFAALEYVKSLFPVIERKRMGNQRRHLDFALGALRANSVARTHIFSRDPVADLEPGECQCRII